MRKVWSAFLSLTFFVCPSDLRGGVSDWTYSFAGGSSLTATAGKEGTDCSLSGTYSNLSNNFVQLNWSSCSSSNGCCTSYFPGAATRYGIQVPGFSFFAEPILTGESQLNSNALLGECPTTTWTGIFLFSLWDSGSSNNVSSANQPAFGVFSWDPATNIVTISDVRNLTSYATLAGFSSMSLATTGACTDGVITLSGTGDRGGIVRLSTEGGGTYRTLANKSTYMVPQVPIPSLSALNGSYSAFNYDSAAVQSIGPMKLTINHLSTPPISGNPLTNIGTDTIDSGTTWSISGVQINQPIDGMFTGTLNVTGQTSTNIACAVYLSIKNTIFCAAQSPTDSVKPLNIAFVSSAPPYTGGVIDSYRLNSSGMMAIDATGTGGDDGASAVAVQSDGKAVIFGSLNNGTDEDFFVMRLLPNGTLDTSFGNGGKTISTLPYDQYAGRNSIALDPTTRKIITGGSSLNSSGTNLFTVMRYNVNGSLDTSFATGGIYSNSLGSYVGQAASLAVDSSGKVLFGASSSADMVVARLTAGGVLDTSFSSDGYTNVNVVGVDEWVTGLSIQSSGKIVAMGYSDTGTFKQISGFRLLSDGTLDTTVTPTTGPTGSRNRVKQSVLSGHDYCYATTMYADDIYCVGWGEVITDSRSNFLVTKYAASNLASSWTATNTYGTNNASALNTLWGGAVQTNGRLVVAGQTNNGGTATKSYVFLRYLATGALDTSFDGDGKLSITFGSTDDALISMAIQTDGKIIAVGQTKNVSTGKFDVGIIRIWP